MVDPSHPRSDPCIAPRVSRAVAEARQDDYERDEVKDGHYDCVVVLLKWGTNLHFSAFP